MWFGRNTDEKEYIKNLKYRKYNTKKKKKMGYMRQDIF